MRPQASPHAAFSRHAESLQRNQRPSLSRPILRDIVARAVPTTKSNLFTSSASEVTLMSEMGAVPTASDRCEEEEGGGGGRRDRLHRWSPNFSPITDSASHHRRTSCSPTRHDSLQKPSNCFNSIRFQLWGWAATKPRAGRRELDAESRTPTGGGVTVFVCSPSRSQHQTRAEAVCPFYIFFSSGTHRRVVIK